MHFFRLREANRLARQALNASTQGQVLVFYFLCILLANNMLACRDKSRITWPVISVVSTDIEDLEIINQLLANFIPAPPEYERQNAPGCCVDGIPKPTLVLFVPNVTPLFVGLNIDSRIKEMPDFDGDLPRANVRIDMDDFSGLFLK